MGNQLQSTRLELEKNINLLRKQVFESAKRVVAMEEETSRLRTLNQHSVNKLASMEEENSQLRTLNQDSVNRCEHLESILEEKTALIRKYQQSSSRVHQKIEEAARVARKQMEDLQAVWVQAVANAQQEVEEMQKAADISDGSIAARNSQREHVGSLSSKVSESMEMHVSKAIALGYYQTG